LQVIFGPIILQFNTIIMDLAGSLVLFSLNLLKIPVFLEIQIQPGLVSVIVRVKLKNTLNALQVRFDFIYFIFI
jgi:hypothetical protein